MSCRSDLCNVGRANWVVRAHPDPKNEPKCDQRRNAPCHAGQQCEHHEQSQVQTKGQLSADSVSESTQTEGTKDCTHDCCSRDKADLLWRGAKVFCDQR